MGVYKAAVVTESGQNLIAQAFTSEKKLIFTSAKTSSYSYPAGTNISALTGLQDVVQSVIPSGTKTIGGNVAQVTVRFDNDSIDQAYLIQTIGLYAKIEDGEETLFSVTQATVPDEMPVHSEVSPSAYIYNIQSTVQNASQITITVNPTGAASVQDFLDIQNPTFDDSGTSEEISSFPEFLDTVKSKMNFFQFFRNLKSGLQFVLHVGSIVNNCVTDNPNLPLSAAQGKALQDALTVLNNELQKTNDNKISKDTLSAQIHNYKFFARTMVVNLTGGIVSGDSSSAYTIVDISGAKASRKPDEVFITSASFAGFGDYLYDHTNSTATQVEIHLCAHNGDFSKGPNVRFSILCIWEF